MKLCLKIILAIKKYINHTKIKERHRHRYEVNNNLREKFEKNGLIFSGMSPDINYWDYWIK